MAVTVSERPRCSVDRAALLRGLRQLVPAVTRKSGSPALQAVRMTAEDGCLKLFGTDLELYVEVAVPAQVERPGAMAPMFRRLLMLVQAAPAAPLELEATEDLLGTRIRWADAEYLLYGVAPDLTPARPEPPPETGRLTLAAAELRRLLQRTARAAADDEVNRPYLNAVELTADDGRLRAVATDSVRIATAWAEIEGWTGDAPFPGVILQKRSALYLLSSLARYPEASVELRVNESVLDVRLGDLWIGGCLVEGQYPDVMRLVPTTYQERAVLNRQAWLAVLRRAAVMSEDGAVRLTLSEEAGAQVAVHTAGQHALVESLVGEARERVPGHCSGALEIGFNSRYLIEALERLEGDEVLFEASGARNPCRLQAMGDDTARHIILPLITY